MAIANRDKAFGIAKNTGLNIDWLRFKSERNTVVKLIKVKKKEYYNKMMDQNKELIPQKCGKL